METKNLYSLFTSSNGVSIDTRNLIKGQIFFSLKGESFNGNNFALEALEKGASYSVIDDKSILNKNQNLIYVDDSLKSLQELSSYHRSQFDTKIIGVTILTSLDNKALKDIGFNKDVKKLVLHQARMANKAKLDAIVCSAQEVKLVKKVFKKEIITPGIRFNSKSNDQKRVLTPKQAYKNGSDWLVMGRPITKGNIKVNIQNLIDHLSQ